MPEDYTTDSNRIGEHLREEIGYGTFTMPDGSERPRAEGGALAVARAFGAAARAGHLVAGSEKALELIRPLLPSDVIVSGEATLQGAEGAAILRASISTLQEWGSSKFARHIPAYEWLWLIRRLPLRPMWPTLAAMDVRMFLGALALSRNSLRGELPKNGVFEVTKRRAERLAFLYGFVAVLTELTMGYRWSGKGGRTTIYFRSATVRNSGDEVLTQRLVDYDRRTYREGRWGGLGIHISEISNITVEDSIPADGPIALILHRTSPKWSGTVPESMHLERYGERFVVFDEALDLLARPEVASEELTHELGSLVALMAAYRALAEKDNFEFTRGNVRRLGYGVYPGGSFEESGTTFHDGLAEGLTWARARIGEQRVPQDVATLWKQLAHLEVDITPKRPGPIIIPAGPHGFLVDWYSASVRLLLALRYPAVQGKAANVRAQAFEETVRADVNNTPCAPVAWLRDLVGRHLRRHGENQPFGEIDAAASLSNDVHFIISCKSYPFTPEYERGDYQAVRNVASKLAEDAESVLRLVSILRDQPDGANYRIPDEAVMVPIVVTPRVMYTTDPLCDVEVLEGSGLRLVSGFGELIDVLSGYTIETAD